MVVGVGSIPVDVYGGMVYGVAVYSTRQTKRPNFTVGAFLLIKQFIKYIMKKTVLSFSGSSKAKQRQKIIRLSNMRANKPFLFSSFRR